MVEVGIVRDEGGSAGGVRAGEGKRVGTEHGLGIAGREGKTRGDVGGWERGGCVDREAWVERGKGLGAFAEIDELRAGQGATGAVVPSSAASAGVNAGAKNATASSPSLSRSVMSVCSCRPTSSCKSRVIA